MKRENGSKFAETVVNLLHEQAVRDRFEEELPALMKKLQGKILATYPGRPGWWKSMLDWIGELVPRPVAVPAMAMAAGGRPEVVSKKKGKVRIELRQDPVMKEWSVRVEVAGRTRYERPVAIMLKKPGKKPGEFETWKTLVIMLEKDARKACSRGEMRLPSRSVGVQVELASSGLIEEMTAGVVRESIERAYERGGWEAWLDRHEGDLPGDVVKAARRALDAR